MFKKILLAVTVAVMTISMAACGTGGQATTELTLPGEEKTTASTTSTSSGEEKKTTSSGVEESKSKSEEYKNIDYKDYENNLDGLCEYMKDSYIVSGDPVEMSYDVIEAQGGVKYAFSYRSKTVQVELYQFDLKALTPIAEQSLKDIREKGSFIVLESEVKAFISDSGEYIMIYSDSSTDAENTQQKDRAVKLLKGFYGS